MSNSSPALTFTCEETFPPCPHANEMKLTCSCGTCTYVFNKACFDGLTEMATMVREGVASGASYSPAYLHKTWKKKYRQCRPQGTGIRYTRLESVMEQCSIRGEVISLPLERLNTLAYGEYNRDSIAMVKNAIRSSLTLHGEHRLNWQKDLKYDTDRSVALLSLEGRPCAIQKTMEHEYIEEVLIHKELCDFIEEKDKRLSILLPTFYGVIYDEELRLLSEYVPGSSFTSAILTMRDEDIRMALRVLHGFLSYLKRNLGFVHGDLSTNNIMLRGWGCNHRYQVPLIEGDEWTMVELSFAPVIFDFGLSATRSISHLSLFYGPQMTTFNDCALLYASLSTFTHIAGVKDALGRLGMILGPSWVTHLREALYLPPLPLLCDQLTHDYLLMELKAMDN